MELFKKGNQALKSDEYRNSIEYYDKAIAIYHDYLDAWSNKGAAFYLLLDYEEALRSFDTAIRINKENGEEPVFDYISNRAAALFFTKKYSDSIDAFNEALQLAEKEKDKEKISYTTNWLAWALATLDRNEEALEMIDYSLQIDPSYVNAIDTKGFILFKLGRYLEALPILDRAIGNDPTNKYPWYNKGSVQLKLRNINDAIRCYDMALELEPNFAEALNGKAVALSHQDKIDESIRNLEKAVALRPDLECAQENLRKLLSFRKGSKHAVFWDFWSATPLRKAVAIVLVGYALGVIVYFPIVSSVYPNFGSNTNSTKIEENGMLTTKITTITTSSEIPQYYLAVVGLVALILLIPDIKSFKFGPVEFEKIADPTPVMGPPSLNP